MSADTFAACYAALEQVYPGKVRRVIEVTPVAVQKTIDNEADACETLRRIAEGEK